MKLRALLQVFVLVASGLVPPFVGLARAADPVEGADDREERKGEGDALAARAAYWRARRGDFTAAERVEAVAAGRRLPQVTELPAALGGIATGAGRTQLPPSGTWTLVGPSPIDGGVNYGGRVPALAVDTATSGAGTVIYLGGANGGVWKSTDNGAHWTPRTDDQPALAIGALAIDPNNHDVVYAGTGEPNQSADSYYGSGVLKSTDAGATWTLYGTAFFGTRASSIGRIVVNPFNSQQVFAASTLGVAVSTDGGVTWARNGGTGLPNGGTFVADDLVLDASSNPVTLYVVGRSGFGGTGYGVRKSTDGGGTWTLLTGGLPGTGFNYRSRLAMAPSNPSVLYLLTVNSSYKLFQSGSYNGGYHTTNGGATWSPLLSMTADPADGGFGGQGWYDLQAAVDPLDDNVLYVGGVDVHVTTNARGTAATGNWHNITRVYTSPNSGMHPDQHALAFGACSASPCRLHVGNDGGVFYSDNATAASASVTYTNLNTAGLAIAEFVGGDIGPNFAATPLALGGTQDNGTQRYTGNTTWPIVRGGDGGFAAINWQNPSIMYGEQQNGAIARSVNGGTSWSSVIAGIVGSPLFYAPFAIDRTDSSHLVFGTTRVNETLNGTSPWYSGSSTLESGVQISALAIAPSNGAVIYAGLTNGHIWRTTGGKSGGSATYTQISSGLSGQWVTSIWVDPANADVAYATLGIFYRGNAGNVFKTTNGGASWASIKGDLPTAPVNSIVGYPSTAGRVLLVGTDVGVYFSTDEGAGWSALNNGLPLSAVNQLAIDPALSTVLAFTHGRSVWALGLTSVSAPTVTTPTATAVTSGTATLGGNVTSDGGLTVSGRGILYSPTSVNADPVLGGMGVTAVPTSGTTGVFTVGVSGLSSATGYTFKAYATNSQGTGYTAATTFTTLATAPTVTTPTSTAVTGNGATLGGNVTSDGGATVSVRGVVYAPTASNADPQLGGSGVTNLTAGGSTGVFTVAATGLTPVTGYSFKAYATNAQGTSYTPVATFSTTTGPPSVTTPTSTAVGATIATLGGNVASDGGASIAARGVVYSVTSTNSNPQLGGLGVTNLTTGGTTGVFTVGASGLTPGTGYSFKAYATNSQGTGYSSGSTFTTASCPGSLTVNNLGDATDATPGDRACATSGAVCTLRAAIAEANALPACTPLTIDFGVTGTIIVGSALPTISHPALTISGPGADQLTLDGVTSSHQMLVVSSGSAVDLGVSGLTISRGGAGAGNAGAIDFNSTGGTLTVTDSALLDNLAGSAQICSILPGSIVVSGSTIRGGVSGIFTDRSPVSLTNSTISGASHVGIYMQAGSPAGASLTLLNSTVSGNATAGVALDPALGTGTLTVKNSILAGNGVQILAYDPPNTTIVSQGNNVVSDASLTPTAAGDQINTDPRLSPLGNHGGPTPTFALLPGSPAIDAGNNSGAPATDQRGIARPQSGTVDVGAFESQGFTLAVSSGSNQSANIGMAFASPLAVSVSATGSEPVNGGRIAFTAPGSGPSASIAGNPATIASGVASSGTVTANATPGGPYTVTATAVGGNSAGFSLTNTATTATALTSSANPTVFGQPVTFTATVSSTGGTPTGTVTFKDGATTLGTGTLNGTGVATFSSSALAVAGHSITAVYGGVAPFLGSTSPVLTQTVNPAGTTTVLGSSTNPSVFGQSVTFTATVSVTGPGAGSPTGTVTFKDGAATLGTGTLNGSGVATFSTGALSVAGHSITALYGGDGNFATSTSSGLTQTVNKASTTTAVSSSVNPSVSGQSVTFTATVTAVAPGEGLPTGAVTFRDGASTLGTGTLNGSGVATFSTSALPVAGHSITAVYAGDASFSTSTSSVLTQMVNAAATTTALGSSTNPSVFGQPVTFTATVTVTAPGAGVPTGMVTFKDGAATLGTGTLNGSGVATFSTSGLSAAGHSISALYGGATSFAASTSSALTQTVNKASTATALTSSLNPAVFGESVTFTATVTATAPGAGVATGTVTFKDGASTLGAGTLNGSAVATFTTSSLSVATHSITAVYGGDGSFTTSTSAALSQVVVDPTVSISDVSLPEGNSGTTTFGFSVTLSTSSPATATVAYATTDGTATTADGDYSAGSGTLTFFAGQTSKTVNVTVNGDGKFEPTETFAVNLSAPTNATILDGQGAGTITNDDAPPTLTIADLEKLEGNSGTTPFDLALSLSNPSYLPITVSYATADGLSAPSPSAASLSVDPAGRFLYATLSGAPSVLAYTVDPASGSLAAAAEQARGEQPTSAAVDPQGRLVYLTRASGSVAVHAIGGPAGVLRPVPGPHLDRVTSLATSADGARVYLASRERAEVAAYRVEAETGLLQPLPGSPFALNWPASALALDPAGRFLYVVHSAPSRIGILAVDAASGALVPANVKPTDASRGPLSLVLHPAGALAFVLTHGGDILTFTVDPQSGALRPTAAPGVNAGAAVSRLALDPSGSFLYAANRAGNVAAYRIDPDGGALTAIPGSPFPAGDDPAAIAVHPSGSFLYVVNESARRLSAFAIDRANGSLRELAGSPHATTAPAPATAGQDYQATSGALTFAPGTTSRTLTVPVFGDTTWEQDEVFTLNLTAPTNTTLLRTQATGTIDDDERARMISPVPGTTFPSHTVTFAWSPGSQATHYWLEVGTTPGGTEIYSSTQPGLTATVAGIPADGRPIYVRLWTFVPAPVGYVYFDYTYSAATAVLAQITSPIPGSTLGGSSATFTWTPGVGLTRYWLQIGTTPGGNDVYSQDQGANLTVTVTGLPVDGRRLYVQLWSFISGRKGWNSVAVQYDSATLIALLTSPNPGTTLLPTTTFTWTPGTGALQYWLSIGRTQGGTDLYSADQALALTRTVTGLPGTGAVWVRLFTRLPGTGWAWKDVLYNP